MKLARLVKVVLRTISLGGNHTSATVAEATKAILLTSARKNCAVSANAKLFIATTLPVPYLSTPPTALIPQHRNIDQYKDLFRAQVARGEVGKNMIRKDSSKRSIRAASTL